MELYQESLKLLEHSLGPRHPEVAKELAHIGQLLFVEGAYAEAEKYLRQALAAYQRTYGEKHRRLFRPLVSMTQLYRAQKRYREALACAQRALVLFEQGTDVNQAEAYALIGDILYQQQRYPEALAQHQLALNHCVRLQCDTAPFIVEIAADKLALGQVAEALPMLETALPLQSKMDIPTNLAQNQFLLAQALLRVDKTRSLARACGLAESAQRLYKEAGHTAHGELEQTQKWRTDTGCPTEKP
jgi:tetratricopeptide (TPR) repeat protein